jgi:hypothetical protein
MELDQQSRKNSELVDTERLLFDDGDRQIVLVDGDQIALDEWVIDVWMRESVYCDTEHPKSDGSWLQLPADMLLKILDQDRATLHPRLLEMLKGLAPDAAQSLADFLESPELTKRAGDSIANKIDFILATCSQQFQRVGTELEG